LPERMKKELRVSAIREGTVIDHIPANKVFEVVDILKLREHDNIVSVATNLKSKKLGKKGIIKIGGRELTKKEVNEIAIIAPAATINIIRNYEVKNKSKVELPNRFENIIKCSNPKCITNNEEVKTLFYLITKKPLKVKCHYCERVIEGNEIKLK